MSILFWDYAGCPKPWLLGMAVAMATAKTIGCNVRWPNDLSFGDRKTGGILTELLSAAGSRQVPVCGVGINLRQVAFPPELPHATSVLLETGVQLDAELLAGEIVAALREMPEPLEWSDLSDQWMTYDHTPGKRYKMLDGKEGVALGISHDAALRCVVDGVERKVLAADALFGVLARDA
jgi:BirA family biotin operon repressor/biotin-[acetyl-CoA-carboxylase] ligase